MVTPGRPWRRGGAAPPGPGVRVCRPLAGRGGEGGWSGDGPDSAMFWWLFGLPIWEAFFWIDCCCIFYGLFPSSRAGALRGGLGFIERRQWIMASRIRFSMDLLLLLGAMAACRRKGSPWSSGGGWPWRSEATFCCRSKLEAWCQPIILAMLRPLTSPACSGVSSTSVVRPSSCRVGMGVGPDCFLLHLFRVLVVKCKALFSFSFSLGACTNICIPTILVY